MIGTINYKPSITSLLPGIVDSGTL